MAKPTQQDADWRIFDTEDLPSDVRDLYLAYKTAYAAMKAARQAFETGFSEQSGLTPESPSKLIFGYNFGRLSVALVPNDRPTRRAAPKSAQSLADFMAAAKLTGAHT